MMTIKLYKMFDTDTLRTRSSAISVVTTINEAPSQKIIIDFENIVFASRSFCNELLNHIKDRKNISFDNVNSNVKKMLAVALIKPHYPFDDSSIKHYELEV